MSELYFVEVNYRVPGKPVTTYFPERDASDLTRAETIKDVRAGQYEDASRIIAVDLDKGTSRDATKEIAQDILDGIDELPLLFLQEFLEHALGVRVVASVLREMEAA
jgi:hypothetical protein